MKYIIKVQAVLSGLQFAIAKGNVQDTLTFLKTYKQKCLEFKSYLRPFEQAFFTWRESHL